MIYLQIFYEFFKTGLFAIGGGVAALPFLREIADKYSWFTQAELVDMFAVASSVPGPLGVNLAAFAGYKTAGIIGGVVAALGIVTPSVIIILGLAEVMGKFGKSKIAADIFKILRPAAAGLITAAALSIVLLCVFDYDKGVKPLSLIIYATLTALCFFGEYLPLAEKLKKPHPVLFLAIGAVVGIVFGKYL